jgi:hypothetical protein
MVEREGVLVVLVRMKKKGTREAREEEGDSKLPSVSYQRTTFTSLESVQGRQDVSTAHHSPLRATHASIHPFAGEQSPHSFRFSSSPLSPRNQHRQASETGHPPTTTVYNSALPTSAPLLPTLLLSPPTRPFLDSPPRRSSGAAQRRANTHANATSQTSPSPPPLIPIRPLPRRYKIPSKVFPPAPKSSSMANGPFTASTSPPHFPSPSLPSPGSSRPSFPQLKNLFPSFSPSQTSGRTTEASGCCGGRVKREGCGKEGSWQRCISSMPQRA